MGIPNFHVINAVVPVADAFNTSFDSDIINAQGAGVLFIIQTGANASGGISTITVEACSTNTASAVATVPFIYRSCVATDVWSDWTAATTAGISSSAVANAMHQIYVDTAELAEEGYGFVRLSGDETTAQAVTAGVLAIVIDGRYEPTPVTLLS
ncbi:hypothetical protein LCGC14_0386750 [marine sediment metagenome]|uniref:Uncharacterized protein n=1 Tax=marine sediment metagenome TaxID=412755 RepID=A0A0F9TIT0_9ZZZZ